MMSLRSKCLDSIGQERELSHESFFFSPQLRLRKESRPKGLAKTCSVKWEARYSERVIFWMMVLGLFGELGFLSWLFSDGRGKGTSELDELEAIVRDMICSWK
jgi:hypothetical protein